jgi:hypothetical protein
MYVTANTTNLKIDFDHEKHLNSHKIVLSDPSLNNSLLSLFEYSGVRLTYFSINIKSLYYLFELKH